MNLSLSYCSKGQATETWQQLIHSKTSSLTTTTPPKLYDHHALTTIYDETEWMVLSGGRHDDDKGVDDGNDTINHMFHVWLLNLTHADLFGEIVWFELDNIPTTTTTTTTSCPSFVFNNTEDPWRRADLWTHSVQCTPSPRQGHLSATINDYFYVFQGVSLLPPPDETNRSEEDEDEELHEQGQTQDDYHVYRIAMKDILQNNALGWRRILPREQLRSASTSRATFKGGLWHREDSTDLPRLVSFGVNSDSQQQQQQQQQPGEVWTYDFSEDSWETSGSLLASYKIQDYSAILIKQYLLVMAKDPNPAFFDTIFLYWLDMATKASWEQITDEGILSINMTMVAYNDANYPLNTVLVGFGPEGSKLPISIMEHMKDDQMNFPRWAQQLSMNPSPSDRTGHSAVLSSYGNMYIFGGRMVSSQNDSLWRINVGGKTCNLPVSNNGKFIPEFFGDDFFTYTVDDGIQDDGPSSPGGGYILLFFLFQLSCFLLCSNANENSRRRGLNHDIAAQVSNTGLTTEQLDAFPQRVLCHADNNNNNDNDDDRAIEEPANVCSICLLEFVNGEEVRDLPCCHFFHKACVDSWLATDTTCPLCRVSCRPAVVEATAPTAQQSSPPSILTTLIRWLRHDQRERTNQTMDNEGFEMSSIYSLELQVEEGIGDDVSILSAASAAGAAAMRLQNEAHVEGRDSSRRRRFRGSESNRSEGTVPLTSTIPGSAMV